MSHRLLLVLSSLALCVACSSSDRSRLDRQQGDNGGSPLVGVWFRGLHLFHSRHDDEVLGLLFHPVAPDGSRWTASEQMLREGEIVATFRSAAELDAIAGRATIQWYAARYGPEGWVFCGEPPPEHDFLMGDQVLPRKPVGGPDAGIAAGSHCILLPPPLEDRGVAVAIRQSKGTATGIFVQRDRVISLLRSWHDLESKMGDVDVELVSYFCRGEMRSTEWRNRGRLWPADDGENSSKAGRYRRRDPAFFEGCE